MAKTAAAFSLLLLLLSFLSGGTFALKNQQKTWCVAKPSSDETTLKNNINYACSNVDCKILQKGCSCFYPDNFINHASIAMNLYYQANGRNYWNCHFGGSGLIVLTDPSKSIQLLSI
ncbi:glucan endo-1,3-beta-glucosidase-like isoform X2 [Ipomoea triloba]|uniref:glucan endo-1,3-beta-glucosidase-like isoform X2 n=1 Tax=Ipomoea triloba TaxID=35885 RepID=UPI00125D65E0|nr:glucan endo-1,3-beta-glucosidase-like isoform X2 [Ipomoea triloba]